MSSVAHNLRQIMRRYFAVWWVYSFGGGFLFGVYPLFLRARGLNQLEMNSVLATYFTVTFLTDVPTGAFADALGRRRSFILGCALRTVAFTVYFLAYRYPMFLLGETIDGIGTTFCNGAIDAWGVDALDQAGFQGLKDRLFSRISQLTNVGFMASAVIGAYVADHNIAWPWVLGAAGYSVAGMVGALLMGDDGRKDAQLDLAAMAAQVGQRILVGLREGFGRRSVLLLSLANGVLFAAWAPYWLEWPQYFNDTYAVGIWIVGWLYSLFTIARLAGAEAIIWTGGDENMRPQRLTLLAIASAILMFSAGAVGHRPSLVLPILAALNFCWGSLMPLEQSWFNEQLGAAERATLLSFNSTFATLGGSIGLLAGGIIADRAGIQATWQFGGLLSLAVVPCYLALRPCRASAASAGETPSLNRVGE
ncbi:MAG: MFS transporter [Deltaproteobacteria bacterium]|nr:MFS transporter [Deltaproteobacteria bacterium]MBV8452329.1 MFS transporter [Deltaproteobacteria bacterium]